MTARGQACYLMWVDLWHLNSYNMVKRNPQGHTLNIWCWTSLCFGEWSLDKAESFLKETLICFFFVGICVFFDTFWMKTVRLLFKFSLVFTSGLTNMFFLLLLTQMTHTNMYQCLITVRYKLLLILNVNRDDRQIRPEQKLQTSFHLLVLWILNPPHCPGEIPTIYTHTVQMAGRWQPACLVLPCACVLIEPRT